MNMRFTAREFDALSVFTALSLLSLRAPLPVHIERLGQPALIGALAIDGLIALKGYSAKLTPEGLEELLRLGTLPEVALPAGGFQAKLR
jgi:hypothetical protein